MSNKRVVITGIGVVSSIGIGIDEFWQALSSGVSGIKEISLFDSSPFNCSRAAEIDKFEPKEILGKKGLTTFDRSTCLLLSAAKLALDNRGEGLTERDIEDSGVAIGTAFGSIASISGFDKESLIEGVRYIRPLLFPNTVINSPASQMSIKFGMSGFNTTISTGFAASTDAIGYAYNSIKSGRSGLVFAGGVEELSLEGFAGFALNSALSQKSDNSLECCRPYDKERNGMLLGEGSAVLVLEELEQAVNRGANILAEVSGYGTACDADYSHDFNPDGEGAIRAMRTALKDANLPTSELDYISGSANGALNGDEMELKAIDALLVGESSELNLGSIKSQIGECFGASGALQTAGAVLALNNDSLLPTINYKEGEKDRKAVNILTEKVSKELNSVMINSFDCKGTSSSLIVMRYNK